MSELDDFEKRIRERKAAFARRRAESREDFEKASGVARDAFMSTRDRQYESFGMEVADRAEQFRDLEDQHVAGTAQLSEHAVEIDESGKDVAAQQQAFSYQATQEGVEHRETDVQQQASEFDSHIRTARSRLEAGTDEAKRRKELIGRKK